MCIIHAIVGSMKSVQGFVYETNLSYLQVRIALRQTHKKRALPGAIKDKELARKDYEQKNILIPSSFI